MEKKFRILDQHIKELGLTPQQVVEKWIENETIDPFDIVPIGISNSRSRRNQPIQIGEAKVYFEDENKQRLFATVRAITAKTLGINADVVQPDSNFLLDLGADSLDFVEIMQGIEDEFDSPITDQDVEGMKTVQDVLDYLSARGK